MILYHVSPRKNRSSIKRQGLTLNLGVIWLCDRRKVSWARRHVANHHGVKAKTMDVWRVEVPRNGIMLRYVGGRVPGRYLLYEIVPSKHLTLEPAE